MSRPQDLPLGCSRLICVLSDEDEAGAFWPWYVSRAWNDELGDVREDFYALADGQPVSR
jgi:hypothetical protein